ncbi:MAG: GSCFA domain-containing protein [Silicimonas sp.]|nr:GSCFA domain-containing protein [Silicimonas sp.]
MRRKAKKLQFQSTTSTGREYRTWFRGENMNILPHNRSFYRPVGIEKFVLEGWMPETPAITVNSQITSFGSCFATNISNYLSLRNYSVMNKAEDAGRAYVVACGEGMVNSFVILQQFQWAWEDKKFDQELWHGYDAESYGYDPEVQRQTREMFDKTDVFILTFGLSEIWYDEVTGNVFWRTIPKDVYDPQRHKFRVSTVEENADNMREIHDLIRKNRPDAKIIYTLSPIPLQATFRDNSCITSNAVSKGIMRVAIDQVVREKRDEGALHYWPSYELITDAFSQPYKHDRRHPEGDVLEYIMMLFEKNWCADSQLTEEDVLNGFLIAGAAAGMFPPAVGRICKSKNSIRMQKLLRREQLLPDPGSDKALRITLSRVLDSWSVAEDAA